MIDRMIGICMRFELRLTDRALRSRLAKITFYLKVCRLRLAGVRRWRYLGVMVAGARTLKKNCYFLLPVIKP